MNLARMTRKELIDVIERRGMLYDMSGEMTTIDFDLIAIDYFVSLSEAARKTGLRRETLSAWCSKGFLPSHIEGRKRLVANSHVQKLSEFWDKHGGQGKRVFEER